jgi:hypothetical protein
MHGQEGKIQFVMGNLIKAGSFDLWFVLIRYDLITGTTSG